MELFLTGGGSRLQQHNIISSWRCWWCATLPSQPLVEESNTAVVLEEVRPANSHDWQSLSCFASQSLYAGSAVFASSLGHLTNSRKQLLVHCRPQWWLCWRDQGLLVWKCTELLLATWNYRALVEYRSRPPNLLWFGVVFGGQTLTLLLIAIGYRSRCSLSFLGEGFDSVLFTLAVLHSMGLTQRLFILSSLF
jgi:hypothetical protein